MNITLTQALHRAAQQVPRRQSKGSPRREQTISTNKEDA